MLLHVTSVVVHCRCDDVNRSLFKETVLAVFVTSKTEATNLCLSFLLWVLEVGPRQYPPYVLLSSIAHLAVLASILLYTLSLIHNINKQNFFLFSLQLYSFKRFIQPKKCVLAFPAFFEMIVKFMLTSWIFLKSACPHGVAKLSSALFFQRHLHCRNLGKRCCPSFSSSPIAFLTK